MRDCTIYVVKTKALICVFVFAYAKSRFSHDEAHMTFRPKGKFYQSTILHSQQTIKALIRLHPNK